MAIESETSQILGLYKQLYTVPNAPEEGESSNAAGGDSSAMEMEVRALCVELAQIICIDDAEYSPEILSRLRVIQCEVRSLLGRISHSKSKSSSLSW
jgi:hypothetical protein